MNLHEAAASNYAIKGSLPRWTHKLRSADEYIVRLSEPSAFADTSLPRSLVAKRKTNIDNPQNEHVFLENNPQS